MANLRNTVVTGSLRLASHGAGMVRTDANGTISTAAMTAGDLPSHNHDDRYYTESEINSLLSAKQDAATAITTSNIGSQSVNYANSAGTSGQVSGVSVSSSQMQYLKNTLDPPTLPYKCDIVVNGDADRFYAVQFWGGDQDVWRRIIIKRGYSEQAPWDPIGTGVHHGGLLLDWEGNFGGWGGAEYADRIRVFNESYTNVCADMFIWSHSMGYVFMLRGGGAIYHLFSDQPINGFYQSGSPDIAYSTSTLLYDDSWSGTNQYDVPAPAPLSLAQVNSSRIDGLRTKKQSLFDGRYQPLENQRLSTGNSPSFSSVSANDVYTTGGWFRNHTNNSGIYWSNTAWHLMPENTADFRFHSGNNSESAIRMETNGTTRGYVYANSSNEIGFLNNGRTWRLRVYSGGAVESYGDFRAPIFYDSEDIAYYLDPASTSNILAAYIGRVLINHDGTDTWFRMQSGNRMRVTTTGGNDFIIPNTGDITFNGTTLATREWVQAQGYRTTDSDNQTLSISGSTLTISGGNSVTLPTGGISQSTADGRYTRNLGQQVYVGSLNDLDGAYTVNLDGYGPIDTAGGPDTAYNASLWGIGNSGRGAQIYLPYAYDQMYFRRGAGGWSSWFRVLNTSADPYPSNMNQYVRTSDSVSFQNVYATAAAGRVSAGSTSTDGMLFDSSRAALIARGNYPHLELWSDVSNSNHGGTIRFGGYDNGSSGAYKSWNIGTPGSDLYFLDIGYGGYNSNPHAGIAGLGSGYGYPGAFTIMRFHNNGNIGVGNFGTYGNGDNDPDYKLDVRGNGRYTGLLYLDAAESLNLYGIRGRFSNEYIHLYNKVGIGHPGGWGQGEGNTPNQGLSTYGGINIAYANDNGATINTYTRINKNWGGGDYGAEAFTIRGTYPSITLRNTGSDSKWLIHTDSSGDLRWYWGDGADNNDWSNQITFYENGRIDAIQFHDANDTAYYLNPAGSSRLRNLYIGDSGSDWSDPGGWGTVLWLSNAPHAILRIENRNDAKQAVVYSHQGQNPAAGSGGNYDFRLVRDYSDRITLGSSYITMHTHVHMGYNSLDYVNQIYQETGGQPNYMYANNSGSYGSLRLTSTRNGWYGIYFDSGSTLMMNSNETGFYRQGYGWQWRWENGTAYVNKNSYGGGTTATVLDSSNYTSWAQNRVYQGQSDGDWQNFTDDVGEFRVDEVLNITSGNHSNHPTGVYTYGGVMSWRLNNHSFQLYASHTGDLAYKTQWSNDNYSGWRRILDNANYPYAANMNQYVRTSDNVSFNRVNAPSGYVSDGNPWGTSNSAYFPNGITTAGGTNWVYGHTYLGNAPSNGSGAEISSSGRIYVRNGNTSGTWGYAGLFIDRNNAATNYVPWSFENEHGNHSWGLVARFHVQGTSSDRPSIQFSSGYNNTRWSVGYCYPDDNFRITQNHGQRPDDSTNDGWGTERFRVNTDGNTLIFASLGIGGITPDVRLSVSGDAHISNIIYLGGSAGTVNSWGTRTYGNSGEWTNNSKTVRFDNVGYGSNWSFTIDASGNVQSSASITANGLIRVNGNTNLYLDYNYGQSIVGAYSSYRYQGVFAMGDAYKLPIDGTGPGNLYGMAWSHPNAGGVASNLNTHGLLVMENGTFLAAISGSIRARDDVRAPALYDSGSRVAISRGEGRNYVDYSRYVYNNGAYSGSGWIEPSDLGVRYANTSGRADQLGAYAACYNDTHPGYGMRVWYNWNYCDSYMNGFTIGSHPSDTYYGWQMYQRMWNDRTYTRRYNGGFQSERMLLTAQDDPYAYNMNQYVRTSDAPTFSGVYTNDWFRANGCTGLYFQTYGYGLRAPECEGNSYGNVATYGTGRNGWSGYGIGSQFVIMGRVGTDLGLHDNDYGWGWYWHAGNRSLGIGESNTSSSYKLYVTGAIYATSDIVAYSDRRKKTDIVTIEDALSKVKEMRGVFYTKIDEAHKGRQVGVIAQEMNEVLPEAVTYAADVDEYGVKYGNIVGVLIEAIKEQQKQIEELKAKLV